MSRGLVSVSTALTAGVFGALASSGALLLAQHYRVLEYLGTALGAYFSPSWLYARLVWGGLWGLLLMVPLGPRRPVGRGLFWSLAPSLYQLLWQLPHEHAGVLGTALGQTTPIVIVATNLIWGLAAALWLTATRV